MNYIFQSTHRGNNSTKLVRYGNIGTFPFVYSLVSRTYTVSKFGRLNETQPNKVVGCELFRRLYLSTDWRTICLLFFYLLLLLSSSSFFFIFFSFFFPLHSPKRRQRYSSPDRKNNSDQTYCSPCLGIMMLQMRAPLELSDHQISIVLRGIRVALRWAPMITRKFYFLLFYTHKRISFLDSGCKFFQSRIWSIHSLDILLIY